MRYLVRGLVIAGLIWLEIVLYTRVQHQDAMGNSSQVVGTFVGIIAVGLVIGAVAAMTFIPALGEMVGNFVFNPGGGEVQKNPYSPALSKIAMGDYPGAIKEYKEILKQDPYDMHAYSEIVNIYCGKLETPEPAEKFLSDALQNEWPPEQSAFLATRLADLYWTHKQDAGSARYILNQIVESMPDTRHAANAAHKLNEIDRALGEENVNNTLKGRVAKPAPAAPVEEITEAAEPQEYEIPLEDEGEAGHQR